MYVNENWSQNLHIGYAQTFSPVLILNFTTHKISRIRKYDIFMILHLFYPHFLASHVIILTLSSKFQLIPLISLYFHGDLLTSYPWKLFKPKCFLKIILYFQYYLTFINLLFLNSKIIFFYKFSQIMPFFSLIPFTCSPWSS